jgi:hypothetical protein
MNPEFNRKFMLVLLIIGVCVFTYGYIRGSYLDKKMNFNGKVDSVSYDIQRTATILIKGKVYNLDNNDWDFDHNTIEKGDSMIKDSNTLSIRLIRRNGQIVEMTNN